MTAVAPTDFDAAFVPATFALLTTPALAATAASAPLAIKNLFRSFQILRKLAVPFNICGAKTLIRGYVWGTAKPENPLKPDPPCLTCRYPRAFRLWTIAFIEAGSGMSCGRERSQY
ncbi:hypothetical protein [Paraburkholderia kirstenboschensis]|uniref:Secreted protein n=1 Tax=Paraburkholderia kirstenboschensis TaxID=1245436 RepID=A0ABZ0EM55_9BURK|nr:hypothetical protein [Paraburkholderia kirstenboschensis]WOD17392.1 hypothetical protein RW095_14295 [Paraburkholderia kirstenboschensis]